MTDMNKTLIVLTGLPGSGKSHARAQAVATGRARDSVQISSDDYIDARAAELGITYSEAFKDYVGEAEKAMYQGAERAVAAGRNVLWDQTNMSRKKRANILNRFPDYYKQSLCILPPLTAAQEEELERRLASRPGKTIPKFVMENMRDNFELPTVAEGFDKVLYFDLFGNWVDADVAETHFGKPEEKG